MSKILFCQQGEGRDGRFSEGRSLSTEDPSAVTTKNNKKTKHLNYITILLFLKKLIKVRCNLDNTALVTRI